MSSKRHLDDGAGGPSKKAKSDASSMPSTAASAAELIALKRAEVAAKMANFSAQQVTKPTVLPSLAPPPPKPAAPPTSASLPPKPSTSVPAGIDPDLAKKIAEAKRRADVSRANVEINSNPYLAAGVTIASRKSATGSPAPQAPIGTGLKMAAHPLLLDTAPAPAATSKNNRYKPMQPKFASLKANTRNAPPPPPPPTVSMEQKINPYSSGAAGTASPAPEATVTGIAFGAPKDRTARTFRFNQKGKYVALGQQMRQDAQLEELKKRIAENARKAGLDSEFETLEKTIRREAPPDVEWWDVTLLPDKAYTDIIVDGVLDVARTTIRSVNSPITLYVQHPIPIPSPWDKNKVELKPAKLTKKEMKKMRKQRRMAEMQDKQDRQKMGLIPPDPPKVRLANLMRVLTSDAVQDPTKVEARVRREVALRKKAHDDMNTSRKLTDEQRREKIESKKVELEKRGIYAAIFKIKNLNDPSHRFKVRKNAEQYGLAGVCIFNPSFSLILVEGSYKAVEKYTRLMTIRIQWTEAAREKDAEEEEDEEEGAEKRAPTRVKYEDGFVANGPKSLEDNRCDKVWEGPLRDHIFKTFKAKSCPTESSAKEFLGEKMASYWDVAKLYVREEDL